MATETQALVSYPVDTTTLKPDWRFGTVKLLRSPKEHELKIRMVATGICHSDIVVASIPNQPERGLTFPKVLGHEGAGIVEEVGPGVTAAQVGDPVLLSYSYCGDCDLCKVDQQPYCLSWMVLNIVGEKGHFETQAGEDTPGKFFGQSSFAGASIVGEKSVVNLKGLVSSEDELKLLAPMGCGLMTGSGAVINGAAVKAHDIVLVTGLGAVGMGAIMAAKIAGCREIIALDRVAHRLETAKELGATKVLDTTTVPADFAEEIQKLVGGQRISVVVETTAAVPVINESLKALGKHGKFIQLGAPGYGTEVTLPLQQFFNENKSFECHCLGNTTGQAWIPVMIKWWREGKFPIEKIVKYFQAKEAVQAIHEMENGSTIKPVLVW
ncbi:Aryl-alcohol dehydrogenase [Cladophialophora carrionii]|uniref:Aryl-alcohol dehydrogenase n=1 Tax=Cladophialophora carrionii TaxID=86049 RepID=A0A1C1CWC3_9EURO|nr:Aryl-alcohol dehydrogenase [Cladophialophora carrionii]